MSFLLLFRQIFCDFGDKFVVSDVTGEQPLSVLISAVTKVRGEGGRRGEGRGRAEGEGGEERGGSFHPHAHLSLHRAKRVW